MSEKNTTDNTGIWDSIKDAFRYLYQSAKGKYSLESYLDVLGQFTDGEINEALDAGDMYGGGEVTFSYTPEYILTSIEMRFFNSDEMKNKTKKAERKLEPKIFTDEAVSMMKEKGTLSFEIKAPRRE